MGVDCVLGFLDAAVFLVLDGEADIPEGLSADSVKRHGRYTTTHAEGEERRKRAGLAQEQAQGEGFFSGGDACEYWAGR